MINYTRSLLATMEKEIHEITINAENAIIRSEQSYRSAVLTIRKLNEFIADYNFKDSKEEISFFKEVKPQFVKEAIYFKELYYLESDKPMGRKKILRKYYIGIQSKVYQYLERNKSLYNYYKSDKTYNDIQFFKRSETDISFHPTNAVELDDRFTTVHSLKLSKLLAYEALMDHTLGALILVSKKNRVASTKQAQAGHLTWTDTKAALVELIYAIIAKGSVNFGKVEIKQLVSAIEQTFNVNLGNFYRVFMDLSIRKKDRTPYLRDANRLLLQYMDDKLQ
ncbi:RteC domain-containing protein [Taibaiella chishuiensis]|uniref:RteC protein n=1 Tax=Taibaiella chishuiensis TaxID=1434707 RepID=A0A2P8D0Q6_9BACT|nr:RteC domain-containing protein [Taibaiella chishuiensis]PSK90794.1 RteC protein [Taibaiella chishuiensis]